jgi:competence protein ComEA
VGSGVTLYKRLNPEYPTDLPIEIIREVQKDSLGIKNPESFERTESALGVDQPIPSEGAKNLDEVIQKTEERLRGEYPEIMVNINTASKRELMLLPRIGPKTAEKIIAYRDSNGSFQTKEEIMKVKGIGEKTFEKLKEMIVVK